MEDKKDILDFPDFEPNDEAEQEKIRNYRETWKHSLLVIIGLLTGILLSTMLVIHK